MYPPTDEECARAIGFAPTSEPQCELPSLIAGIRVEPDSESALNVSLVMPRCHTGGDQVPAFVQDRWPSAIELMAGALLNSSSIISRMRQARHLEIAIALFATTAVAGLAQDAGLRPVDTAFVEAVANVDRTALERLLDADFTWTNTVGKVQTKAQVLREMPKMAVANTKDADSKAYMYGELGDVQVNAGRSNILRVWVKRSNGWKAIVYQEAMSRETPPSFTPGAGKECENPCKTIAFTPKTDTERQVALAYSKLETAAHARNSAAFAPMVADEFVAASSNSDKLQSKRSRMEEFDHSRDAGVAPTPLLSARMFTFGDAVLMVSEHKPDRGSPLHVTRVWVKRGGSWVETLSYQTAVTVAAAQ